jgi:hypothetical protein
MNKNLSLIITALALSAAAARADDMAQKGREIFNANQHAVVTVEAVLKITGGSSGPSEVKTDSTGTVLDATGLTVLALSSVDPADLYKRLSERNKMETEVSEMKILLADGTEMPAEIVLRDKDLDLAFVRPKAKPAAPMAAVDLSKSSTAEMLEPLIVLNRLNRAAGRAYSACVQRIAAVIQKPRTFYIPETSGTSVALGSPAFSLNGNIVGLFVRRAVNAGDASARNMNEYMTVILTPAEDILKGAKQAPEAKGDVEKPADKPADKAAEKPAATKTEKDAKDQK